MSYHLICILLSSYRLRFLSHNTFSPDKHLDSLCIAYHYAYERKRRFTCGVPCSCSRPKVLTSEDMDGKGRDVVVDNLLARIFRNLLARPALTTDLISNSELIPGLLDLADAVTDISLGHAGMYLPVDWLSARHITFSTCFSVFSLPF